MRWYSGLGVHTGLLGTLFRWILIQSRLRATCGEARGGAQPEQQFSHLGRQGSLFNTWCQATSRVVRAGMKEAQRGYARPEKLPDSACGVTETLLEKGMPI